MGSRAVVVLCRDPEVARRRFGVRDATVGACFTRTGRRFFNNDAMEHAFFADLLAAFAAAGFWDRHATDWVCLDCELMPWSAKALELLRGQYAAVAAAGRAMLSAAEAALVLSADRGTGEIAELLSRTRSRRANIEAYSAAYGRYCWDVASLADIRLAPFHILATEGKVHSDRSHKWHMDEIAAVVDDGGSSVLLGTRRCAVTLGDCRERGRGGGLVGGIDRDWRRGDGGQARKLRDHRSPRAGATGGQVPGTRIPSHHLRTRLHGARESPETSQARALGQAVAGPPRIRPRCRGTSALRRWRTAAPRSRVCVWNLGVGKRSRWIRACRRFASKRSGESSRVGQRFQRLAHGGSCHCARAAPHASLSQRKCSRTRIVVGSLGNETAVWRGGRVANGSRL